jgi:hypothetical protein
MEYQVVRVPKTAYDVIDLAQSEILERGISKLAPWLEDLLESGAGKGRVFDAATICLVLVISGKKDISKMGLEEVKAFLKDKGYPLPARWQK